MISIPYKLHVIGYTGSSGLPVGHFMYTVIPLEQALLKKEFQYRLLQRLWVTQILT